MNYDMAVEEEKKAYHRDATQKSREGWQALGVRQLTMFVPNEVADLVRGQMACTVAVHLWALINGDESARMIVADRVPKYRVMHPQIEALSGRSEAVDVHCAYMFKLLKEAKVFRTMAKDASYGQTVMMHAAACEYIVVYYLIGYFDVVIHTVKTGDDMPQLPALDLEKMSELPNVL